MKAWKYNHRTRIVLRVAAAILFTISCSFFWAMNTLWSKETTLNNTTESAGNGYAFYGMVFGWFALVGLLFTTILMDLSFKKERYPRYKMSKMPVRRRGWS